MAQLGPETSLRELTLRITKGTTPTSLGRQFTNAGVNYIKSQSIGDDGRIDTTLFAHIDEDTHRRILCRSILEEGDILISMAGVYLGKTAIVEAYHLPANTNQAVGILRLDRGRADPRFVRYCLARASVVESIRAGVAQSAQPNINLREIGNLTVPLPLLDEQRRIAAILGALDDKIELNRKMNLTLEEIAQAIFKSWFIDFDGHDDLVESELGMIPRGWEAGKISDVADLNATKWNKRSAPERIRYLDLKSVKWGTLSEPVALSFADAPSRARMQLLEGDTIFGTVRPANGSYGYVDTAGGNLTGSTGFAVIRPHCVRDRLFVYLSLTRSEVVDYFAAVAHGSAYPAVAPDIIHALGVTIPPEELRGEFAGVVDPLFERRRVARLESHTLAQLRDTLLPKLISGEIRVPEAEELVEDAV